MPAIPCLGRKRERIRISRPVGLHEITFVLHVLIASMSVYHMCACDTHQGQKKLSDLRTEVTDSCEPPCGSFGFTDS